jgi:hypothetical protein
MGQFQIRMEGQLRFLEKKCHNFWLTTLFCMNESFVTYDFRELLKKSELKIIKYGYIKGCPKRPEIQIGLLEILGISELIIMGFRICILYKKSIFCQN